MSNKYCSYDFYVPETYIYDVYFFLYLSITKIYCYILLIHLFLKLNDLFYFEQVIERLVSSYSLNI